jgi:hypothetical protein
VVAIFRCVYDVHLALGGAAVVPALAVDATTTVAATTAPRAAT